jgi:hypothetical protein
VTGFGHVDRQRGPSAIIAERRGLRSLSKH